MDTPSLLEIMNLGAFREYLSGEQALQLKCCAEYSIENGTD